MDVNELIKKAWQSVEQAGIPEPLQPDAFREAVAYLREQEGQQDGDSQGSAGTKRPAKQRGASKGARRSAPDPAASKPTNSVGEDDFFRSLADESGVEEGRLRDCLQLTAAGSVHVTQPTKNLGSSRREQAKNVVALVASARARGLGENPVSAEAVRDELKRKHCWDTNNFSRDLGALKGFNAGSSRDEMVLTSKWVDEFETAVGKVLGDRASDSD